MEYRLDYGEFASRTAIFGRRERIKIPQRRPIQAIAFDVELVATDTVDFQSYGPENIFTKITLRAGNEIIVDASGIELYRYSAIQNADKSPKFSDATSKTARCSFIVNLGAEHALVPWLYPEVALDIDFAAEATPQATTTVEFTTARVCVTGIEQDAVPVDGFVRRIISSSAVTAAATVGFDIELPKSDQYTGIMLTSWSSATALDTVGVNVSKIVLNLDTLGKNERIIDSNFKALRAMGEIEAGINAYAAATAGHANDFGAVCFLPLTSEDGSPLNPTAANRLWFTMLTAQTSKTMWILRDVLSRNPLAVGQS